MSFRLLSNILFILAMSLASYKGFALTFDTDELAQICKMLDHDCQEAEIEVGAAEEDVNSAKGQSFKVASFEKVANEAAAKLSGCKKIKEELCQDQEH